MRLHNRQIKATFWTDTDLIQHLTREQRMFYVGLWQLADDSGCLFDDPFAFKIQLYPGDMDITPEVLAEWRDRLASLGKLMPYRADGKQCLYLKSFRKHQTLRSPAGPTVPLPSWIEWIPSQEQRRSGKYEVSEPCGDRTVTVATPYGDQPEPEPEPEGEREREGGTGETTSCDAPPPDATETERLVLAELKQVTGYPLDFVKDLEHIRALETDFPTLDLLAEAKRWRVYKMDKPLKPKSNARLQFRNWCEISSKRGGNRGAPKCSTDKDYAGGYEGFFQAREAG